MRAYGVILAASLLLLSAPGEANQLLGPIWRQGANSVVVTLCAPGGDHDESCRAAALRIRGQTRPLGSGYIIVRVMPVAGAKRGQPAVTVLGDNGGSGGEGDFFAIVPAPHPIVGRLTGERMDSIVFHPHAGRLALDLPFNIEFFNGAPHAGVSIVPLPILWAGDDFAVDMAALTRRRVDMRYATVIVRQDLGRWAQEQPDPNDHHAGSGTPAAVEALTGLILSGHADVARAVLHKGWPTGRPGERRFWNALSAAVVRHPWWARFGLDRLPHAAMVLAAARGPAAG